MNKRKPKYREEIHLSDLIITRLSHLPMSEIGHSAPMYQLDTLLVYTEMAKGSQSTFTGLVEFQIFFTEPKYFLLVMTPGLVSFG